MEQGTELHGSTEAEQAWRVWRSFPTELMFEFSLGEKEEIVRG